MDGTSNTIMMGEICVATENNRSDLNGNVVDFDASANPASCKSTAVVTNRQYNTSLTLRPWRGDRWCEGKRFLDRLRHNPASEQPKLFVCGGWDGGWGLYSAGSRHVGGCQVLLGDGSVDSSARTSTPAISRLRIRTQAVADEVRTAFGVPLVPEVQAKLLASSD